MQKLSAILPTNSAELHTEPKWPPWKEQCFQEAQRLNAAQGSLRGYNCSICRNKGYIFQAKYIDNQEDWYVNAVPCQCSGYRNTKRREVNSGLGEQLKDIKTFVTAEKWQRGMKEKADKFPKQDKARCFFVGGQSGAGKTHICKALAKEMVSQVDSFVYARWPEECKKQTNFADEARFGRLEELKNVHLLYIDDFLKQFQGQNTRAEVALAYEIIEARYTNMRGITIISSELLLNQIFAVDTAIGRRISEMSGEFRIDISADENKIYKAVI